MTRRTQRININKLISKNLISSSKKHWVLSQDTCKMNGKKKGVIIKEIHFPFHRKQCPKKTQTNISTFLSIKFGLNPFNII